MTGAIITTAIIFLAILLVIGLIVFSSRVERKKTIKKLEGVLNTLSDKHSVIFSNRDIIESNRLIATDANRSKVVFINAQSEKTEAIVFDFNEIKSAYVINNGGENSHTGKRETRPGTDKNAIYIEIALLSGKVAHLPFYNEFNDGGLKRPELQSLAEKWEGILQSAK